MWGLTFIIGLSVFVLGGAGIYLVQRWNDNKITAEKRKEVRNLRWDLLRFNSKLDWILIIVVPIISVVLIQGLMGYKNLGLAILMWFLGFISLKECFRKNKAIVALGISEEYARNDLIIAYLYTSLFVVVGIIYLFS